jgi:ABC-type glycerol-3-phosphate transport system substrate-binding protein
MILVLRNLAVLASLAVLAACASSPPAAPPEIAWSGGDPARLAADKAQCRKEAENIDVKLSAGYSDPRYGVTSAMAAYVDKDNPLDNRSQVTRDAAFVTCMNDKGWKQAQ